MKRSILIVALALGIVSVLGLTAFSFAQATGAADGALTEVFSDGQFGHRPGKGALRPYIEEASAEILGMTVEELQEALDGGAEPLELIEAAGLTPAEFQAALEAALPDLLAQAVEDGAITQEEADAILESGLPESPFGMAAVKSYILAASAEILGISVEELEAALEAETPFADLLDEAGLTHLQFRQALDEATPGIVEQALAEGAITEAQAENLLEYGLMLGCHGRHGGSGHGQGGPGSGGFGPGK